MRAEITHGNRVVTARTLSVAQAISAPPEESMLTRLNRYFETAIADTPELLREAHELRYRVYCLEMSGFEDPKEHPDGLEKDAYDVSSVHGLLIHRASRQATGTVRLVLPRIDAPEHSFAIQSVTDHPALKDPCEFPHTTAEVSRFCISRQSSCSSVAGLKFGESERMYSPFPLLHACAYPPLSSIFSQPGDGSIRTRRHTPHHFQRFGWLWNQIAQLRATVGSGDIARQCRHAARQQQRGNEQRPVQLQRRLNAHGHARLLTGQAGVFA